MRVSQHSACICSCIICIGHVHARFSAIVIGVLLRSLMIYLSTTCSVDFQSYCSQDCCIILFLTASRLTNTCAHPALQSRWVVLTVWMGLSVYFERLALHRSVWEACGLLHVNLFGLSTAPSALDGVVGMTINIFMYSGVSGTGVSGSGVFGWLVCRFFGGWSAHVALFWAACVQAPPLSAQPAC